MQVSQIIRALPVMLALASSSALAQTRYRIAADNAWLHHEPDGRRLARFARGATVSAAGGSRGGWVEVGLDGWIIASSVAPSNRPDFDLLVSKSPNENLRTAPGGGGAIIAQLSQGFGLHRAGQDSTARWLHVTRTGWAPRAALTPIAGETTARAAASPDSGSRPVAAQGVDSSRAQPVRMTTLYRAPDGPVAGNVEAETPLRVLSRSGEWTRVQFEGWVKGGELRTGPPGVLLGVTAAELRAEPQRYVGQVLRWRLEFIALQKADDLRPDIPNGATYILARGPLPERGFVYVIVPPPETRAAALRALTPLGTMLITARVRSGRSRYLGNPVVELISLEEGVSP